MQLQVEGCIDLFVESQDCRLLLFEVMTEAQGGSSSVRQMSEKISGQSSLPKLSDEIFLNPLAPLINILIELLKRSQMQGLEESIKVRQQVSILVTRKQIQMKNF